MYEYLQLKFVVGTLLLHAYEYQSLVSRSGREMPTTMTRCRYLLAAAKALHVLDTDSHTHTHIIYIYIYIYIYIMCVYVFSFVSIHI